MTFFLLGLLIGAVAGLWFAAQYVSRQPTAGEVAAAAVGSMLDTLSERVGTTRERAYVADLKSDLKNFVLAQESFFVDHSRYGSHDEVVDARLFSALSGVDISTADVTDRGWSAIGRHFAVDTTCGVYVGAAQPPHPSLTEEGWVDCW
jgi:hypothetical protein